MSVVDKFNGLHGAEVSREDVQHLVVLAQEQEQREIVNRLGKLLEQIPENEKVEININNRAIEVVPESFINCLDCEHDTDATIQGLGKAVSPNEIYQMMTDKIIKLIKQANETDYQKKWQETQRFIKGKGYTMPINFISKKPYRGINTLLLTGFKPLKNPFFMTFKQVQSLKGKVKKGSQGHEVIYFTRLYKYKNDKVDISGYDLKKFITELEKNKANIPQFSNATALQIANTHSLSIIKYYNVFNGKDIEGINFDLENFKRGFIDTEKPASEENRMPAAEGIINNYPKPSPRIGFGGDRAYYSPDDDFVQLPKFTDFETAQDYYRTTFHELAHSTGHGSRLARKLSMERKDYAFEELIAEFSATFLSAEAGILWHTNKNHAAYLKHWNNALTFLEEDNRFLMRAATQAQKAADFILQYDDEGNPKYFKDINNQKSEELKPRRKTRTKKKPALPPVAKRKRKIEESKQLELALNRRKPTGKRVQRKPALASPAPVAEVNPVQEPQPAAVERKPQVIRNNPKVRGIGAANDIPSEYFEVAGETGKFLQRVERKPFHSVVITLDGEQGAGKTTTLYQWMNDFALPGNRCVFISGEEHPDSDLAKEKANKYISAEAQKYLDITAEVESVQELYSLVADYDIIFIDSWQKLLEMVGNINLDKDLRKKLNGKVFIVIFQQTTTGRAKGGAAVVFDGDIITKMVKGENFEDNYAYFNKNRYTKVPLETLNYNIATGKVYNPLQTAEQTPEAEIRSIENSTPLEFTVI